MSPQLLDVLFKSEKRKNILLLLQDGPKETSFLLNALKTTRQGFLPQTKILEDEHLVYHYEDTYELTPIGKLLVDQFKPLLDTLDVLDTDIDYWGEHDLGFSPPHLLKRLYEMKGCCILKPSLVDMYEINKDFIRIAMESRTLYFIFSFTHPKHYPLISQCIANDQDLWIIVTRELYQKFKEDHREMLEEFIGSGKVKLLVYQKDIRLLSFALSEGCMVIRLLAINGSYDYKQLICCEPPTLQWGKELFEHYVKDAELVTEI